MPFGLTNTTIITMDNISYIGNSSSFPEFLVRGNEVMFGGIGFFLILCVGWLILFLAAQYKYDMPVHNVMYSGAVISIVSLFIRAIEINVNGVWKGLISDYFMWIFPLITILLAWILWLTKE